jgi:hypothetical protein
MSEKLDLVGHPPQGPGTAAAQISDVLGWKRTDDGTFVILVLNDQAGKSSLSP